MVEPPTRTTSVSSWRPAGGVERRASARPLQRPAPGRVPRGLAVGLGFKGGLFNIGAQGQFLMGARGSVWIGTTLSGAAPAVAVTAAVVAGMAGGALWAFIPAVLKAFSGAHEVVTTIML